MGLGERIKYLRKKHNLSQTNLAEILKIGKSTLSQYESNARTPSIEILGKIIRYFCTSSDYLLGVANARISSYL